LGEFYRDSAIKMQAFIAFAARKFGSLLAFDVEIEQNKRKRSFAEIFVAMNVFS